MSSSTRQALAAAKESLRPLLSDADLRFAEELFAIGVAVSESKQLRGILSDPSAETASKKAAIVRVFGKSVTPKSVDYLASLAGLRWSKGSDLVQALEQLAVFAVASIASSKGKLEQVEKELFEFRAVVEADQDLQIALASRQARTDQKIALLDALVKDRVGEEAGLLIRFASLASHRRRIAVALEQFGKVLSSFAGKLVATVTVAAPLSEQQLSSLESALSRDYGSALRLNVEVDPSIIGGVKVQVAGEIIDGSVANRLNQARMMLA